MVSTTQDTLHTLRDQLALSERPNQLLAAVEEGRVTHAVLAELAAQQYCISNTGRRSCLMLATRAAETSYGKYFLSMAQQNEGLSKLLVLAISPEERHATVVKAYDFTKFGCIADIGGGNGMLLARILAAHSQGRGILYDRSGVVEDAIGEITALASAERCKIIAGDFFENVPKGADIYVLSQIVHDWDDKKALQILRNCRKAVADDAVLLLIERSLNLGNGTTHINNFLSDIEMLVLHRAAERSTTEYQELLDKSGFRIERVIGTASPFSLIECFPV